MQEEQLSSLIERSAKTDLPILLQAKESAKRAMNDDPSPSNVANFERLKKMVEDVSNALSSIKDPKAVLAYIRKHGHKVGKSKLYQEIGENKIRRQKDGSFLLEDVRAYMKGLPLLGNSDQEVDEAQARQAEKERQEIRRIKAGADKEEFALAVRRGQYVAREQVFYELAGRAVALSSGLKTSFESAALELVSTVNGDPRKAQSLVLELEKHLDEALHGYAQVETFEVLLAAPEGTEDESAEGDEE